MKKKFRLTAPKPFIPTEFEDQVALFEYAAQAAKQDERWNLLFATLNGVRLPIGLAVKMKKAGNKQGVPDVFLPVARWNGRDAVGGEWSYGLWIELKREKGGVVSPEQKWWHQNLTEMGYRVEVCKGAKEAIAVITRYLAS